MVSTCVSSRTVSPAIEVFPKEDTPASSTKEDTPMSSTSSLPYRAEIDGLRAFAVLPVVFYHFDLSFPGGFVGVDVFFVISGFLITSILLRDLAASDRNKFSFVHFLGKRLRRLFPALAVLLTVTFVCAWFTLLGELYTSLLFQAIWVLLFGKFKKYLLGEKKMNT